MSLIVLFLQQNGPLARADALQQCWMEKAETFHIRSSAEGLSQELRTEDAPAFLPPGVATIKHPSPGGLPAREPEPQVGPGPNKRVNFYKTN